MEAKSLRIVLEVNKGELKNFSDVIRDPLCYFIYDEKNDFRGVCYYTDIVRNLKNWRIPFAVEYKNGCQVSVNDFDLGDVSFNKINKFSEFIQGRF